jgi:hypothetical protein
MYLLFTEPNFFVFFETIAEEASQKTKTLCYCEYIIRCHECPTQMTRFGTFMSTKKDREHSE